MQGEDACALQEVIHFHHVGKNGRCKFFKKYQISLKWMTT